jgi:hypothetical protein
LEQTIGNAPLEIGILVDALEHLVEDVERQRAFLLFSLYTESTGMAENPLKRIRDMENECKHRSQAPARLQAASGIRRTRKWAYRRWQEIVILGLSLGLEPPEGLGRCSDSTISLV